MICYLSDIVHNQAGIQFDKNKDSMNYGNIVLYSAEHQTYNENMNYQRMRDRLKEKQVSHLCFFRVSYLHNFSFRNRKSTNLSTIFLRSIKVLGGISIHTPNMTMNIMITLQPTITLITFINGINSNSCIYYLSMFEIDDLYFSILYFKFWQTLIFNIKFVHCFH